MLVSSAEDQRIDLLGGAVEEMGSFVLEPRQQRPLLEIIRPFEAHRLRAVARRHRFRAVFPALRADILGRIAAADDQHVLALEFQRIAEVVGMQHAAVEGLHPFEIGDVRRREVAARDHDVIELLVIHAVLGTVMRRHRELLRLLIETHHAHGRAETHPFAHIGLLDATLDIVPEHGARRIGGNGLAEMLFERIVGEFQAFLGAVRP